MFCFPKLFDITPSVLDWAVMCRDVVETPMERKKYPLCGGFVFLAEWMKHLKDCFDPSDADRWLFFVSRVKSTMTMDRCNVVMILNYCPTKKQVSALDINGRVLYGYVDEFKEECGEKLEYERLRKDYNRNRSSEHFAFFLKMIWEVVGTGPYHCETHNACRLCDSRVTTSDFTKLSPFVEYTKRPVDQLSDSVSEPDPEPVNDELGDVAEYGDYLGDVLDPEEPTTSNDEVTDTEPATTTTKSFYRLITKEEKVFIKHYLKYTERILGHFESRAQFSSEVTTFYQSVLIVAGDPLTIRDLTATTAESIFLGGNLKRLIDYVSDSDFTAQMQNSKSFIYHNGSSNRVKTLAERALRDLSSHNFMTRPANLANAELKETKRISELQVAGKYLSEHDLTTIASRCMSKLDQLKSGDQSIFQDYQRYIIVFSMIKNPCYRNHEYSALTLRDFHYDPETDQYKQVIKYNKNTSKKGKGTELVFSSHLTDYLMAFVSMRRRIRTECKSLFVKESGAALTGNHLTQVITLIVSELCPTAPNVTCKDLRFLQSAYIWRKYKTGEIGIDEMNELCRVYDRSMEVWEGSYAFTDDVVSRNLTNDLEQRIWSLF